MPTEFHFPEDAFTLQLFLQRTKGLIDVVIANDDLHLLSPAFQAIEVLETAIKYGWRGLPPDRMRAYTTGDPICEPPMIPDFRGL